MPERILALVGPPVPRDRLAYEVHAGAGEQMVRSVAGVSEVAEIVGAHEERFDGTGYPAGLSGGAIPVESRIVACAAAHVKLAQILAGEPLARALEAAVRPCARPGRRDGRPRAARARARAARRDGRARARDLIRPAARCRSALPVSSIPMAYPLLLSPLRIGPIELRNRIVSTAHQTTLVEDGLPTGDFVAYHAARAAGGAGLICIEATAVHPSGLLTGHTIAGYDPRVVERLARVARPCTPAAPACSCSSSTAAASRSNPRRGRPPWLRPPCRASASRSSPEHSAPARSRRSLRTTNWWPATRARPGLDGIELCASHGYLPTQFLSERSNQRDDAWGGDAERRLHYVSSSAAARCGAARATGSRWESGSPPTRALPEGRHAPETAAILRTLAGEGLIDYASAVIGDSASYLGAAWIVPPPPIARDVIRAPAGTLHEGLAVPLIATSRIHEPAEAEALLAAGAADAVGMTRALIADPDLPRRLVEGREDERILCTGCNQGCIGHYHLELPISCLQNPRTGREARADGARAAVRLERARRGRRPGGHGRCRGRGARGRRCHPGRGLRCAGRAVRARRPRARAPRDGCALRRRLEAPARERGRPHPPGHADRRRVGGRVGRPIA